MIPTMTFFHLNLVGRLETVLDVFLFSGLVVLEVLEEFLLQVVVVDHLRRRRTWKRAEFRDGMSLGLSSKARA